MFGGEDGRDETHLTCIVDFVVSDVLEWADGKRISCCVDQVIEFAYCFEECREGLLHVRQSTRFSE